MNSAQLTFQLSHQVDYMQSISNTDHPDRMSAEKTLDEIRRSYGSRLIKATIVRIKNRSGSVTYNVRYHIRQTKTVNLF